MLLAQGAHPNVLQEMLGYSSVSIPMDLYSYATPTLRFKAAVHLDAVLRLSAAGAATA